MVHYFGGPIGNILNVRDATANPNPSPEFDLEPNRFRVYTIWRVG